MSAQKQELIKMRTYCLLNMEHFESSIENYETNGSDLGIEFCKGQIDSHERCLVDCRTEFHLIQSQLAALDN